MVTRCECCDLLPNACGKEAAKKQEAGARQQRAELVNRGWFAAKFHGVCKGCGADFEAGTLIKGTSDGFGRTKLKYFAECCSEVISGGSK